MHAKKECVTISSLLVIPRLILNGLTHDLKKVRIKYVLWEARSLSLWEHLFTQSIYPLSGLNVKILFQSLVLPPYIIAKSLS